MNFLPHYVLIFFMVFNNATSKQPLTEHASFNASVTEANKEYTRINRREDPLWDDYNPQEDYNRRQKRKIDEQKDITLAEARRYFSFSGVAYCPRKIIEDNKCKHCSILRGTTVYKVFESIDPLAIIVISIDNRANKIIVAFSLSKDPNSVKMASFRTKNFETEKNIKVDTKALGFIESIMNLIGNDLKELFKNPYYQQYQLILTGHRYGGTLAVLSAPLLQKITEISESKIFIYTYGQPRIGNKDFTNWLNFHYLNYYRVVNGKDVIPQRPESKYGYYHGGQELFLISNRLTTFCHPFTEDPNCSNKNVEVKRQDNYFMKGIDIRDPECLSSSLE